MLVTIWTHEPPTWRSERSIVAHFHSSTSLVAVVVGRAVVLDNEDELY